jgi:putative transposase
MAVVTVAPALARVARFANLLELTLREQMALEGFETKNVTGRPMRAADFMASVEQLLGRAITPRKRGRKPKGEKGES